MARLKFNEANLTLQKDLSRAQATATSASASASKTSTSACGAQAGGGWREEGGRGTKRGREDDDGTRRPEIAAGHATGTVPDMLKVLLVDDWDAVMKNSQVWFQSRTLCFCVALNRPQCVCLSASCSPVHLVLS
jgi:mortality factor 4-like protein 1